MGKLGLNFLSFPPTVDCLESSSELMRLMDCSLAQCIPKTHIHIQDSRGHPRLSSDEYTYAISKTKSA